MELFRAAWNALSGRVREVQGTIINSVADNDLKLPCGSNLPEIPEFTQIDTHAHLPFGLIQSRSPYPTIFASWLFHMLRADSLSAGELISWLADYRESHPAAQRPIWPEFRVLVELSLILQPRAEALLETRASLTAVIEARRLIESISKGGAFPNSLERYTQEAGCQNGRLRPEDPTLETAERNLLRLRLDLALREMQGLTLFVQDFIQDQSNNYFFDIQNIGRILTSVNLDCLPPEPQIREDHCYPSRDTHGELRAVYSIARGRAALVWANEARRRGLITDSDTRKLLEDARSWITPRVEELERHARLWRLSEERCHARRSERDRLRHRIFATFPRQPELEQGRETVLALQRTGMR